MGNRFDFHSQRFVEALNQVPVVYYESKEVIAAFKIYQEHCMNPVRNEALGIQKLIDLFKAMYKHLNIDTEPLTDNFFRSPFGTRDDKEKK